MKKADFISWSIIFALTVSSCSIEVGQPIDTIPSPQVETNSRKLPSSQLPMTQIPVTWADLNLTGKLVYVSNTMEGDKSVTNVQMLDLVTGDIATIFSAPDAWVYYVTISPDAKWLVMSYAPPTQMNSPSNRNLYIMSLDGTMLIQPLFTPSTPDDHYTQAEWSPDGKYIYYVHYNHNEPGGQFYETYVIFRMRYPDGEPEKIVDHAFWPRLSSDSTKLVYVTLDPTSGTNELFLANADGSESQRVTLSGPWTPEIIDAPIFSPDGQSILFSAPGPSQSYQPNWFERLMGIQVAKAHNIPSDWWSVPVTGGVPTRLTNIQTINLFASISQDKKHIASVSRDGIFLMDWDGSNLIQLIMDPGVHGTVSWIP